MEFSDYFSPINLSDEIFNFDYKAHHFAHHILFFNNEEEINVSTIAIAIIGVEEDRNNYNNKGCGLAPNLIRKHLYKLVSPGAKKIIDLGNLKIGATVNDTYFALSNIIEYLIKNKVIPIIIGGSQDLTYANFLAYQQLEQTVNLVTIDSNLNFGEATEEINANNFLTKIILHQPNFLFNYANIGHQSYFVSSEKVELVEKLYFDAYRLGQIQQKLEEAEPIIRNADFVSFDISSVRQSEAPANKNASPNGFYGEQACQLARYAGISDKLTSIGFYEVNPELDINNQTVHSVAQMIWYFMEGVNNRKNDFPIGSRENYTKYVVSILEGKHDLVFYKSDKSDRWWIDVPYPSHNKIKFDRHLLVPCTYSDYQTACNNEMPDKWWQTFQKLI